MNHLQLIIKREYLNKIRNRSFILMTFLSPIIMVLIFTLVAYLSQLNNESVNAINILDESGLFANSFEDSESVNYTNLENISLNEKRNCPIQEARRLLIYMSIVFTTRKPETQVALSLLLTGLQIPRIFMSLC